MCLNKIRRRSAQEKKRSILKLANTRTPPVYFKYTYCYIKVHGSCGLNWIVSVYHCLIHCLVIFVLRIKEIIFGHLPDVLEHADEFFNAGMPSAVCTTINLIHIIRSSRCHFWSRTVTQSVRDDLEILLFIAA